MLSASLCRPMDADLAPLTQKQSAGRILAELPSLREEIPCGATDVDIPPGVC